METINAIELTDPDIFPDDVVLKKVLRSSFGAYEALLDIFSQNGMTVEWRYYNDGKAWLCKVQLKKRTIVWISAWKGFMKAVVYFPERLVNDICGLDISDESKDRFRNTKNVGKSKPCIFEIKNREIFKDLSQVIQFKIIAK